MDAHVVVEPESVDGSGQEQFELAVTTFKLLGDVTRLKILWALLHGEHSVKELATHVGANPPAVSQQLAKLRAAGLVRVRRDGNRLFYAAKDAHVLHLVEQALSHSDHEVGSITGRRAETPRLTRPVGRRRGA
ncbi:MAG TPA: metalloregulator ArsR/SmtB family transcription factor [Acidimicrobiales bacterium]|nr:metalloregulator ArsR/SmtB family transcription factor [Acidimicrobiales bacterium]